MRRLGLLQATALNMSNMIGVGPFITIPLLMSAINGGGPQAMLGWLIGVLIAIPDGMIWSELGAAMPGSGGSYLYLREGFGRETFGRLVAFLFIWQFVFSGPLEIASGYIGFAQYLGYVWHGITPLEQKLVAAGVGILNIALLYRQITSIGKITIGLWIGTLLTTGTVIVAGATHFNPKLAFDFPPHAFDLSLGFVFGLGAATRLGIYDYLGYYDVCYLGDEVKDPGRVIPRSILISIVGVALIYAVMNLSIIGVVPWRSFVPADNTKPVSDFVVSVFMEKLFNARVADVFTLMILWTTYASVFALLLGYSRIPYAAAIDGYFFKIFGRVHAQKRFPHVSLLAIGMMSIACSFFSLD
ncbi:MAG: APC family permease, partial [Verrucomicrobia bacterium]|nr:APC family permease [Verrucomicrobiota bacterium]